MGRFNYWVLMVALACVTICSADSDEGTPTEDQVSCKDYPEGSWRACYLDFGRETYEMACASCHDEGKDRAPIKGDRDSWSTRSQLWSSILVDHAKNGYLRMPARGGQMELSDKAMEAAVEFMLSETFPEMPRD